MTEPFTLTPLAKSPSPRVTMTKYNFGLLHIYLLFNQFEDFGGTFHFGVAEEIDAEGEHGGAVRFFADVAFQSGETASLDAHPVA